MLIIVTQNKWKSWNCLCLYLGPKSEVQVQIRRAAPLPAGSGGGGGCDNVMNHNLAGFWGWFLFLFCSFNFTPIISCSCNFICKRQPLHSSWKVLRKLVGGGRAQFTTFKMASPAGRRGRPRPAHPPVHFRPDGLDGKVAILVSCPFLTPPIFICGAGFGWPGSRCLSHKIWRGWSIYRTVVLLPWQRAGGQGGWGAISGPVL